MRCGGSNGWAMSRTPPYLYPHTWIKLVNNHLLYRCQIMYQLLSLNIGDWVWSLGAGDPSYPGQLQTLTPSYAQNCFTHVRIVRSGAPKHKFQYSFLFRFMVTVQYMMSQFKVHLKNSKKIRQRNKEIYGTACKLIDLHVSFWNCRQAHRTAGKHMELHAKLNASSQNCVELEPLVNLGNL